MPISLPKVDYDVVALAGGLDLITPTLSLPAGVARDGLNFECAPQGGYARVAGYERYDGRPRPSDASYTIIEVAAFTNVPNVGDTLTGNSSAATGVVIAVVSGSNYVAVTKVTGAFTNTEVVKVGATTIGTRVMQTVAISSLLNAQYLNLAAAQYRTSVGKVPGSGAVRGVFGLTVSGADNMYAFRDNVGGTATDLYRATTGGWSQITFKHEVSFTNGQGTTPVEGETLTQAGNTAIVRRVMDTGGAWTAGSPAVGRFVVDAPAPGAFAAGAATLSGGATVTLSGADTAITLAPGGRFETVEGNFAGQAGTIRIYGCDGVNRAFEFDGTTLAPIATGSSPDQPKHVVVHKNHLILSIQSSLFHSGDGTPFRWTAVDGGGEIAVSDTITGFLVQPGAQTTGTLAVFARTTTFMLYGTGAATWNLVPFNTGTGGLDYTAQNMAQSYALDARGVISLQTTLAFGNFTQATLTNNIKTFILSERSKVVTSSILREKSQYRLFFNDGYGLYLTIVNGKYQGAMPVYFPNIVNVAWEGQLANGNEVAYFGDTTGYVHQLEVGSSFDGAAIDAFIQFNWNAIKSPRLLKRFRHGTLEMQGNFYANISFGYRLGYATSELTQPTSTDYASAFQQSPAWDSFVWDSFTWDGVTLAPTDVDITGTAENIEITISSTTAYIQAYTINSIILHYTPRRGLR